MNHLAPMISVAEDTSSLPGQQTAAAGGGHSTQPPSLLGSPVHSAPNLPANTITLPTTPHFHKKSRKKRKELDALVPEEKIRRKSSFGSAGASCSFNGDSDDTEGGRLGLLPKSSSMSGASSGFWSFVPGVLAIVLVVGTAVMAMAALRLLMVTRRDMETLTRRLGSVEARSSELPARFHEAHVRLQELQRNTSALWEVVHAFRESLETHKSQVDQVKAEVSSLQSSVQASPLLTSLPQDVQALQSSVASFGSTLQDLQTAVRSIKALQQSTGADLSDVRSAVSKLENSTALPAGKDGTAVPVGVAVAELRQLQQQCDAVVAATRQNMTDWKEEIHGDVSNLKVQQAATDALLQNVSSELHQRTPPSQNNDAVASLAADVRNMSDRLQEVESLNDVLAALSQNVSVVKGVEKKLEGSQLQLASSVSSLKQQLLALQHSVSALTPATTTTSAPDSLSATPAQRSRRRKSVSAADEEPYSSTDIDRQIEINDARRGGASDATDDFGRHEALGLNGRDVKAVQVFVPSGAEDQLLMDPRNSNAETHSKLSPYPHLSSTKNRQLTPAEDPGVIRYSQAQVSSFLGNVISASDGPTATAAATGRRPYSSKAEELSGKSGLHFVRQTTEEDSPRVL